MTLPQGSCPDWREIQAKLSQASPRVLSWAASFTPPLPTAWPPTGTTAWVRYRYAWGMDPSISDGVRVGAPWCREELDGAGRTASSRGTESAGTVLGIQGIKPLPGPPTGALDREREEALFRRAFPLRALPTAKGSPELASEGELRSYYGPWLQRNGVVAGALESEHGDFLGWVRK